MSELQQPDAESAPLLVTQRYGRGATWLLATGSTWHWQMSLDHEDQRHETFWKQLLYTLVAPAPPPVSLQPERSVYEDGTPVTLEAEVLDKEYGPLPAAKLTLEAKSPEGSVVPARIELTIDTTFDNWGSDRSIGVHRLKQPWTELGATWNWSTSI